MIKKDVSVYVSLQPIDMRKAIDGLLVLIVDHLKSNPQSGSLYLFVNRDRKKIKGVYWDRNGFVMLYKRLEKGRFQFPNFDNLTSLAIGRQELHWLLAGFHFTEMSAYPEMDFSAYY